MKPSQRRAERKALDRLLAAGFLTMTHVATTHMTLHDPPVKDFLTPREEEHLAKLKKRINQDADALRDFAIYLRRHP
jgi:hypothetical protein